MRQKETETRKIENKKHVIKHDTDTFDKTPNILSSSANTIQFKRFLIQIRRYKKFNLINLVVCLACVYPINVLSMYNILEMRKNDRFDHCALIHLLLKANNKASLRVYVYFFLFHYYLVWKSTVLFAITHILQSKQIIFTIQAEFRFTFAICWLRKTFLFDDPKKKTLIIDLKNGPL